MKKIIPLIIVILIFLSSSLLVDCSASATNHVYFIWDGERIEPPKYYEDKRVVTFEIVFGVNCTQPNITVNSPILLPYSHVWANFISAGEIKRYGVSIIPNSLPGKYNITIYLNYTDQEGQKQSEQYYYEIELLDAFKITEIKIPKGKERTISITMEAYLKISKLEVFITASGDIDVENENHIFEDLNPGNITVSTKLSKSVEDSGNQGFTYVIRVRFDSGEEVIFNDYIPMDIEWTLADKVENPNTDLITPFLIIGIIIMILLIIYYSWLVRRRQ